MGNDDVTTVPITGDMIRLGQFLKFADFAESGSAARDLIVGGDVTVDGEVEIRRGRQLAKGMLIEVQMPAGTLSARVG
ncbi:RNA-binding S4 domain-containing protein [Aeromicrobium sp.]|uniref:RNA-binding S4 domain-containing protein n=1 Tax=Aeromicrobium sp. TaxID=1871063 RepID=UPI0019A18776|nr:RNA-binding S4 domain-containing protein [Aeromicrobium sp.]MBC7632335.1 RNA-binding S4 domain-containing protein [Aeromicrobium sp.]